MPLTSATLGRGLALLLVCLLLSPTVASSRDRIRQVRSWAYQLQKVDVDQLATSPYELIVIDHADERLVPWDPAVIEQLRNASGSPRLVLAYLSIGEAEDYRPYWNPAWRQEAPEWMGASNPNWRGNYPVKYWHPQWREILLGFGGYVDILLAQGFDGFYLDRVDVYEKWGPTGSGPGDREESARTMVALVRAIAHHVRTVRKRENAIIVAQNAPELSRVSGYLDAVDALALEDLLYESGLSRSTRAVERRLRGFVGPLMEQGVPVFTVDYMSRTWAARRYERLLRRLGAIPYAAPSTALDRVR